MVCGDQENRRKRSEQLTGVVIAADLGPTPSTVRINGRSEPASSNRKTSARGEEFPQECPPGDGLPFSWPTPPFPIVDGRNVTTSVHRGSTRQHWHAFLHSLTLIPAGIDVLGQTRYCLPISTREAQLLVRSSRRFTRLALGPSPRLRRGFTKTCRNNDFLAS